MSDANRNLAESAAHWDMLADEQDRSIAEGWSCCPSASKAKAETYRRTAEAIRIEMRTGIPVCSCCHKPRSR